MTVSDWVGITSAIIAVAALGFAAWTFRTGAELQAFLALTERYEKIMEALPVPARTAAAWDPDVDPEFVIRLRYLNLCSEEFYLHKRWLLSGRVWRIWVREIEATLASEPYVVAWHDLREQFESYVEFSKFVDAAQADS